MSYDLHIGDAEFNYTYNLSSLFRKHIKDDEGAGIRCLDGLTGRQAALVLWSAFESIQAEYFSFAPSTKTCIDVDRAMSKVYTPENGWGSYTSAIIFLGRLLGACAANPRSKLKVY